MQQGVAVAAGLHRLPAVEPQAVVRVEDLTVAYGGEAALRNVTLTVREGEFVLVTGASGCGKTTLARCLNGLIPHLIPARVAGRIEVAGLNPLECEVRDMASRVGMVFQVPETQLFNLTVEEEVAFGCRNLGLPHEEVARRTDFALAGVGLEALRRRALHQLSGRREAVDRHRLGAGDAAAGHGLGRTAVQCGHARRAACHECAGPPEQGYGYDGDPD